MEYKIPLFKLNYDKDEENAVIKTIRSKWISMGPKCSSLEKKFSQMLNVKYSVALSSCTSAIHLALKIVGIKKGDEVIVPSLTFVATVNPVLYVQAIPRFCDINDYDDLNLNVDQILKNITKKTKAIIIMHYAGFPCEMDKILEIAHSYNIKVIEDACHGPLSEYKGRKLGTIGDIGCFSFFSNKNISTGEGGMLVTNNNSYYDKAKLLRSHGMTTLSYDRAEGHSTSYDVVDLGYNYRIDDIRATLALIQLEKLEKDLQKRAHVRKRYIDCLLPERKIIVPFNRHAGYVSNYIFPIVLKNSNKERREYIRQKLFMQGIQTSVHYPAVHRFKIYHKYKSHLPKTEYVTDNEITLPMFSTLTDNQIDVIVKDLKG